MAAARAAKRRRTDQVQGIERAWGIGELTHSASSSPSREGFDAELSSEAIPHDTLVALQLLVNQFPPGAKVLKGLVLAVYCEAPGRHSSGGPG